MVVYNLTLLSLILLLVKQDPFRFHEGLTAALIPMDGQGLNPLLQNYWMVIHPPIMFIGYASLGIPFAFAIAALWMKKYDEWTKVSMPWVLLSLASLGTAIMLGGYWAYETLGWGGYWGWDPVENASLVPWLATLALTHGMLLAARPRSFPAAQPGARDLVFPAGGLRHLPDPIRCAGRFLGPLLCRSRHHRGCWSSTWASSWSCRSACWSYRWSEIPAEVGDEPFMSRTIFFVVGILLTILIGVVVLFGTSAPLISRIWGAPAQVGPDFYNRMGFWLAVVFSLFLGGTPFLGWSRARKGWARILGLTSAITAVVMVGAVAVGLRGVPSIIYVAAAVFCVVTNLWATIDFGRNGRWRMAGGPVAHIGLGLMMMAFLTTGWLDRDQKVRLAEGEPKEVLGYTLTFRGVEKPTPQARDAMVVEVTSPRGQNFVLKPKMWVNQKTNQMIANPDIKSFLTKDLYLAPVEFAPGKDAPVSSRMMLTKDEPASFRDWTLTFKGFDLTKQNAVPGRSHRRRGGRDPTTGRRAREPRALDGVHRRRRAAGGRGDSGRGRRQDPRHRDERRSGRGAGRTARSRRRHRPHRGARQGRDHGLQGTRDHL